MLAGFRRCTCAVAPRTPCSRTISPFAMHVPAPRFLYQSTSVLAGTNGPIGMPESKTCSSGCRCQAMLARLRRRYRTGGVPMIGVRLLQPVNLPRTHWPRRVVLDPRPCLLYTSDAADD